MKAINNNFLFLSVLTIMMVFGFLFSCGKGTALVNVDPAKADMMIKSDNPPVLIDVRSAEEFTGELGHIPGARLIPLPDLRDSLSVIGTFGDRDLLIVCRSGRRSTLAGNQLMDSGFKSVYNLRGGMNAWIQYGGDIEK